MQDETPFYQSNLRVVQRWLKKVEKLCKETDRLASEIIRAQRAVLQQYHDVDEWAAEHLITLDLPVGIQELSKKDGLTPAQLLDRMNASPAPTYNIDHLQPTIQSSPSVLEQITSNTKVEHSFLEISGETLEEFIATVEVEDGKVQNQARWLYMIKTTDARSVLGRWPTPRMLHQFMKEHDLEWVVRVAGKWDRTPKTADERQELKEQGLERIYAKSGFQGMVDSVAPQTMTANNANDSNLIQTTPLEDNISDDAPGSDDDESIIFITSPVPSDDEILPEGPTECNGGDSSEDSSEDNHSMLELPTQSPEESVAAEPSTDASETLADSNTLPHDNLSHVFVWLNNEDSTAVAINAEEQPASISETINTEIVDTRDTTAAPEVFEAPSDIGSDAVPETSEHIDTIPTVEPSEEIFDIPETAIGDEDIDPNQATHENLQHVFPWLADGECAKDSEEDEYESDEDVIWEDVNLDPTETYAEECDGKSAIENGSDEAELPQEFEYDSSDEEGTTHVKSSLEYNILSAGDINTHIEESHIEEPAIEEPIVEEPIVKESTIEESTVEEQQVECSDIDPNDSLFGDDGSPLYDMIGQSGPEEETQNVARTEETEFDSQASPLTEEEFIAIYESLEEAETLAPTSPEPENTPSPNGQEPEHIRLDSDSESKESSLLSNVNPEDIPLPDDVGIDAYAPSTPIANNGADSSALVTESDSENSGISLETTPSSPPENIAEELLALKALETPSQVPMPESLPATPAQNITEELLALEALETPSKVPLPESVPATPAEPIAEELATEQYPELSAEQSTLESPLEETTEEIVAGTFAEIVTGDLPAEPSHEMRTEEDSADASTEIAEEPEPIQSPDVTTNATTQHPSVHTTADFYSQLITNLPTQNILETEIAEVSAGASPEPATQTVAEPETTYTPPKWSVTPILATTAIAAIYVAAKCPSLAVITLGLGYISMKCILRE